MKAIEQNDIADTIEEIALTLDALSSQSEKEWDLSVNHMTKYLKARVNYERGLDLEKVALLAAAGMQFLHDETMRSLSGKFTEGDITALMGCYQGDIVSPNKAVNVSVDILNSVFPKRDENCAIDTIRLIEKLHGLNTVQRFTLVDVIEQIWYQGGVEPKNIVSPKNFLASIDIELK